MHKGKFLYYHCTCTYVSNFYYRNDYIFWTDTIYDRIYRARTNGSNAMIIVNTGMSCAGEIHDCITE